MENLEELRKKIEKNDEKIKKLEGQVYEWQYKNYEHMQEYLKTVIIITGALSAFSVTLFKSQYLWNSSLLVGAIIWFLTVIFLSLFVLKSSIQKVGYSLFCLSSLANKKGKDINAIRKFKSFVGENFLSEKKSWKDRYDPLDITHLFLTTAIILIISSFLRIAIHGYIYGMAIIAFVLFLTAIIFCRSRKKNRKEETFKMPSLLSLGDTFDSCGVVFMFFASAFFLVAVTALICNIVFCNIT